MIRDVGVVKQRLRQKVQGSRYNGLKFTVRGSGAVLYESIVTQGTLPTMDQKSPRRDLGFVPCSCPDRFVNSPP